MHAAGPSYCKQNPVEYDQLPTHRLQMSTLEPDVVGLLQVTSGASTNGIRNKMLYNSNHASRRAV